MRLGLLPSLISVIQKYFREMEKFIDKYSEEANSLGFNERRWLEFRSLFVRVYRQPSMLKSRSDREAVIKITWPTFKGLASNLNIGKPQGSCFILDSEWDARLAPSGWQRVQNNCFRRRDIGVGMFNWWGATEMLQTLESPEKEVCQRDEPHSC